MGGSFKMGWGKDIRHIRITGEGASLRSYLDVKAPFGNARGVVTGGWWISGGYEMNYQRRFHNLYQLKQYQAWSLSGLVGISKKIPVNTKFFKNTSLKLLWNFLSYQQVPRTQPILFRVGYNL
ncbi:MAG: hypothetical protein QM764_14050 [Chitinophagaceae bacterium]